MTFTGHGTDSDGTITAYEWSSSINGIICTTASFSTPTLSAGTHTITFKVMDNGSIWSNAAASSVTVGSAVPGEHIYLIDGYSHDGLFLPRAVRKLQSLGATLSNGSWTYTNPTTHKTFFIHMVEDAAGLNTAIKTQGAHIIFNGHANFGLGATFATDNEVYAQRITAIRYINDDRFTNFSSDMVSVKIDGVQYGQAYPNWFPIYKDGTSGIMPYTFSEGLPPYNYYLTCKVPGDPAVYKVELEDGRILERFPDAATPAWFSVSGAKPDPRIFYCQ